MFICQITVSIGLSAVTMVVNIFNSIPSRFNRWMDEYVHCTEILSQICWQMKFQVPIWILWQHI